ncbi:BMC domain-containing protein [uncultured Cetobacterium sp.]|uniref:BMC domain-containing protein n=1 Tax=uncultured Cetobacterium sp. TaxID=527638 RepID=UPI0026195DC0|nr:BMC domain-containing protein [uncultured Cetobacterium sp.]
MEAFGFIETKGLVPAIESADVMVKTANVNIVEKTYVGGGLVTITITGDVGAVKSSVEAGIAAILQFGQGALISSHVIAKPHDDLKIILNLKEEKKETKIEIIEEVIEIEEMKDIEEVTEIIEVIEENPKLSAEEMEDSLKDLSIQNLRKILKDYKDTSLTNKVILKLNKKFIIEKIMENYKTK